MPLNDRGISDYLKNPTLNSCYNVQFSISWQYLSSKLQKSPRIPNLKLKVDISSNFIDVRKMIGEAIYIRVSDRK
jgi:hypothetical protein